MSGVDVPAISVLVVNHNAGRHLHDCLERLRAVTGEKRSQDGGLEIILVDNASTDGSTEAVREFQERGPELGPPVRLIPLERNVGFGAGCNRAARHAAGRYLLLLNPDAWIDGASLRLLGDALDGDSRLGVAAPALHYPDGSPQFVWAPPVGVLGEAVQRFRNRFEGATWNHRLLPRFLKPFLGSGWFSAACLLVRRSAFEEVGGFDEGFFLYFEDADLGLRIRRSGWRQVQVADARAWHVRGATTAPSSGCREVGSASYGGTQGSALLAEVEWFYRASQLRYYALHRPRWERAVLRRRLCRRFGASPDEEQRRALLKLLDEV